MSPKMCCWMVWLKYVAVLADDQPDTARRDVQLAIDQWSREGFHLQHLWHFSHRGTLICTWAGPSTPGRGSVNIGRFSRSVLLMRVQSTRILSLYLRARISKTLREHRPMFTDPLPGEIGR